MKALFESSYWNGLLSENTVVVQWLLRLAATFAIMFVFNYWQKPAGAFHNTSGQRLKDDLNKNDSTRTLRSAMLDKVEKEQKEKSDIKHDIKAQNGKSIIQEDVDVTEEKMTESEDTTCLSEDTQQNTQPTPDEARREIGQEYQSNHLTSGTASAQRPPMRSSDNSYPGLVGFRIWYDVQTSLYRIYTIGNADGSQVFPPFIPKSERGHVPLTLKVTNNYRQTISVYWINYRGDEIHKGNVKNGSDFNQTTWIGHPWVFREMETGRLLCHYIPYRIIPNTRDMPTIDHDDPEKGIHRFTIYSLGYQLSEGCICHIYDPILPVIIKTPQDAAIWSFQEMSRAQYLYADTLIKYLTNIVMHPDKVKYRQIRIANPCFSEQIWNTPARGLLLAAGFVEQGSFTELGSSQTLPRDRVQDISSLLFEVEKWKRAHEQSSVEIHQPRGSDGFGRANFGRPGLN